MVLENLPWSNVPGGDDTASLGSVLVSLTSCSVLFRDNLSSRVSTASYQLPIEPIPSTFVLNFDTSNLDAITTFGNGGQLAELYVEFDVGKASSIVQKLATQVDFSSSDDGVTLEDIDGIPDMTCAPPSKTTTTFPIENEEIKSELEAETPPFSSTHNPKQYLPTSINDFEEQKQMLQQLHLRMEQDARNLDLTLRALGCISVFLWGVLIWAVYQFYRSKAKSAIRHSITKPRRVLKDAKNESQPQTQDKLLGRNERDHALSNDGSVITETKGLGDPQAETPLPSLHSPTVISSHEQEKSHTAAGSSQDGMESPIFDSQIVADAYDDPRTPSMEDSLQEHFRPARIHTYHDSPYTLEKFERDWMERKTIRRSNRKTKRSYLRPITLPSDFPGGRKVSNGPSNERWLIGPPQVFSVVRDSGNKKHAVSRSKSSSTEESSSRKPPISSVSYRSDPSSHTPSLCYTPASEDDDLPADHFVNDYWF
jgi:hypothetical protein